MSPKRSRRAGRARPAPPNPSAAAGASRPTADGGRAPAEPVRGPAVGRAVRPDGRTRRGQPAPARTPRAALLGLAAAAVVAIAAFVLVVPRLVGPGASGSGPAGAGAGSAGPSATTADAFYADCPTSQPPPLPVGERRTVTVETPRGQIVIEVDGSLGPNAAGNFVALAQCGYYDNVVFHRIAPGFVVQAGDGQFGRAPNVDAQRVGQGGPGYQFPNDPVTVGYERGVVAMANAGVDTNGSQFFICLAEITTLPPNYSVFGRVVSGMETVDAIAAMPQEREMALDPVPMTRVTVTD